MMRNLLSTLTLIAMLLAACGDGGKPAVSFGFRGSIPGRFASPRGIAVTNEFVYVIDRTGRVQVYSHQGEYVRHWMLEKYDNGTPTGLDAGQDGAVWIPDTHNSRILKYSPDGTLLFSFGENGTEPGKFQFLTDVAIGPDGNLYIAEYGVIDRIQVFNQNGEYIRHWGQFGDGEEDFQRPMAIVFGKDHLLYIADTVNNRIKAYSMDGKLSHLFGEQGETVGRFSFPYDLDIDDDSNIYTVEFSGHRVQKWSSTGTHLGSWGSAGSGASQLSEPWGIALTNTHAYIADTLNHRIQIVPLSYF